MQALGSYQHLPKQGRRGSAEHDVPMPDGCLDGTSPGLQYVVHSRGGPGGTVTIASLAPTKGCLEMAGESAQYLFITLFFGPLVSSMLLVYLGMVGYFGANTPGLVIGVLLALPMSIMFSWFVAATAMGSSGWLIHVKQKLELSGSAFTYTAEASPPWLEWVLKITDQSMHGGGFGQNATRGMFAGSLHQLQQGLELVQVAYTSGEASSGHLTMLFLGPGVCFVGSPKTANHGDVAARDHDARWLYGKIAQHLAASGLPLPQQRVPQLDANTDPDGGDGEDFEGEGYDGEEAMARGDFGRHLQHLQQQYGSTDSPSAAAAHAVGSEPLFTESPRVALLRAPQGCVAPEKPPLTFEYQEDARALTARFAYTGPPVMTNYGYLLLWSLPLLVVLYWLPMAMDFPNAPPSKPVDDAHPETADQLARDSVHSGFVFTGVFSVMWIFHVLGQAWAVHVFNGRTSFALAKDKTMTITYHLQVLPNVWLPLPFGGCRRPTPLSKAWLLPAEPFLRLGSTRKDPARGTYRMREYRLPGLHYHENAWLLHRIKLMAGLQEEDA